MAVLRRSGTNGDSYPATVAATLRPGVTASKALRQVLRRHARANLSVGDANWPNSPDSIRHAGFQSGARGMRYRLSFLLPPAAMALCAFGGATWAQADRTVAEIVPQLGHSSFVSSLAISANGRLALTGSDDRSMILWDVESGSKIKELLLERNVRSVAISPDGKSAVSAADTLKLWDLATGQALREFKGSARSYHVAYSPGGRTVLSDHSDNSLKLWDLATGAVTMTLKGHLASITSLSIARDAGIAVSGSKDRTVKVWDLRSGREIRELRGHSTEVTTVAITPDGKFALSGSKAGTLKQWDLATGALIRDLGEDKDRVNSVAISLDGKLAAVNSSSAIRYWSLETGLEIRRPAQSQRRHRLEDYIIATGPVAISPLGKITLFARTNGIGVADLSTGRELRTFNEPATQIHSVAISPNGKLALSSDWGNGPNNTLKLWDLANGRLLRMLSGHRAPVDKIFFLPGGRLALSRSDAATSIGIAPELKLWELETGHVLRDFAIKGLVSFSADGKTALAWRPSGNEGNTLEVWSLETGAKISEFNVPGLINAIAVSPNGRAALIGGSIELELWDLETTHKVRVFKEECGRNATNFSVRDCMSQNDAVGYSPDGNQALTGAQGIVKLWDLTTGRLLHKFEHAGLITLAIISPDGKFGVTGNSDRGLEHFAKRLNRAGIPANRSL